MIPSLYKNFQHWSSKGSVYIISDPHFGEGGMYGTPIYGNAYDRFTNEDRVGIYNKIMSKNDTCICLGDVGDPSYIEKIKTGYKVLLLGNHDKRPAYYEKYFNEIYSGPLIISEKIILSHEPIYIPGIINIHGHDHSNYTRSLSENYLEINLAGNIVEFEPFNLGKEIKNGLLSLVDSIHRIAINNQMKGKR